jgi:high affinity Mn2+ porin
MRHRVEIRSALRRLLLCGTVLVAARAADAQTPGPMQGPTTQRAEAQPAEEGKFQEERYGIHFQATATPSFHPGFHAEYSGLNSLPRDAEVRTSVSSTLYLGAKLWEGGAVYADPEMFAGQGIGHGFGVAGYPNGDLNRVSTEHPTVFLARAFYRQSIGFGGPTEQIEADQDQLARTVDVSRVTVTAGKFSAADVFDANEYAHDPRSQFLNWTLFDNGAWDYAADVRGYTLGGAVELNQARWALRYGAFLEPSVASGPHFDYHIGRALEHNVEYEQRYTIANRPGKLRLLAFYNRAHMGDYREATLLAVPDITRTRSYSTKYGFGVNVEQQLADDLGLFARLGWNDGLRESWAFTEIDRTASLGLSLKGTRWGRADDTIGLAGVVNGLSSPHRRYLERGGHGFIIGDGRLRYDAEEIGETYYALRLMKGLTVTGDVQFINHPAYNRDRGPVWVATLRLHYEF